MNDGSSTGRLLRFGPFEVDLQSGELRKSGVRVRLQEQPFRVLSVLLERPGEVVTREDLRQKLWPDDTFVEFEQGLNAAVNRLRTALSDSASDPRWIETLPRRGYRFLGAIEPSRAETETASATDQAAQPNAGGLAAKVGSRGREILWAALAISMTLAFLASLIFRSAPTIQRPVSKWSFAPEALATRYRGAVISPNGKHIAFRAGRGLPSIWIRDIDSETPRRLAGTVGAMFGFFWSPDSRWIGFAASSQLKKISVNGGPVASLSQLAGGFTHGAWSPDGETIIFAMGARIYEVASSGGEAKLLVERTKEAGNANPFFLPRHTSGPGIAFFVGPQIEGRIVLKESKQDEPRTLVEGGWSGAYSPSGHIVFDRLTGSADGLWALPFALDVPQPTGQAFRITERGRQPSVSENGTLVYLDTAGEALSQLVWRDRDGRTLGTIGQPQAGLRDPVISPDGRRVAVRALEGKNYDIWVHDIERPAKQRLTFDAAVESRPQWSPSGRQVAFQSIRKGGFDIFQRAADGTGDAEPLVEEEGDERPYGWSRDGEYLVYTIERRGGIEIRYLKRKGDGGDYESVAFLETPFNEGAPNLSPDGRFIAYCSDESGEDQVYVSSFPSGDGKWQVSAGGGRQPRWSPRGDELFYVQYDTLMAAKVRTSPSFASLSTTPLFSDRRLFGWATVGVTYDVSADGRFVMVDDAESAQAKPPAIHVVENWYEEFRDRGQD